MSKFIVTTLVSTLLLTPLITAMQFPAAFMQQAAVPAMIGGRGFTIIRTPNLDLSDALFAGNAQGITAALAQGAQINPQNQPNSASLLQIAAIVKKTTPEVLSVLIKAGADMRVPVNAFTAFEQMIHAKNIAPLQQLIKQDPAIIRVIREKLGAFLLAKTAFFAIQRDDMEALNLFAQLGATTVGQDGIDQALSRDLLDQAALNDSPAVVNFLFTLPNLKYKDINAVGLTASQLATLVKSKAAGRALNNNIRAILLLKQLGLPAEIAQYIVALARQLELA